MPSPNARTKSSISWHTKQCWNEPAKPRLKSLLSVHQVFVGVDYIEDRSAIDADVNDRSRVVDE